MRLTGADDAAGGDVHHLLRRERREAVHIVKFDEGDAGASGGSADLDGIGAGRERGEDDGVESVGGEREAADLTRGRRDRGGGGGVATDRRGPVVVRRDDRAAAEELELRVGEHAGDAERRERGADGADEHLLRGGAADHEAGDQHVCAGADLAAGGEIAQEAVAERRARGEGAHERAAGAAGEGAGEEARRRVSPTDEAVAGARGDRKRAGDGHRARARIDEARAIGGVDRDGAIGADDRGERAGGLAVEIAGVDAGGDRGDGAGERGGADEGEAAGVERAGGAGFARGAGEHRGARGIRDSERAAGFQREAGEVVILRRAAGGEADEGGGFAADVDHREAARFGDALVVAGVNRVADESGAGGGDGHGGGGGGAAEVVDGDGGEAEDAVGRWRPCRRIGGRGVGGTDGGAVGEELHADDRAVGIGGGSREIRGGADAHERTAGGRGEGHDGREIGNDGDGEERGIGDVAGVVGGAG